MGQGFYQVIARYGFMETPDVPQVLRDLARPDANGRPVTTKLANTTFYLGRETVIPSRSRREARTAAPMGDPPVGQMVRWRQRLFIVMARNAQSATAFFGLPPNRVVELGAQIQF
jgi:KUP system potassium uptake protein